MFDSVNSPLEKATVWFHDSNVWIPEARVSGESGKWTTGGCMNQNAA
jgi:hypothetical protein